MFRNSKKHENQGLEVLAKVTGVGFSQVDQDFYRFRAMLKLCRILENEFADRIGRKVSCYIFWHFLKGAHCELPYSGLSGVGELR